jgi:hypothetical protein
LLLFAKTSKRFIGIKTKILRLSSYYIATYIAIMMKFVALLVASAAMMNVASAFKIQRAFGFRTSALSANKMDGVVISGDLTPLANNLLIKVKEAAISTTGWQKLN